MKTGAIFYNTNLHINFSCIFYNRSTTILYMYTMKTEIEAENDVPVSEREGFFIFCLT